MADLRCVANWSRGVATRDRVAAIKAQETCPYWARQLERELGRVRTPYRAQLSRHLDLEGGAGPRPPEEDRETRVPVLPGSPLGGGKESRPPQDYREETRKKEEEVRKMS